MTDVWPIVALVAEFVIKLAVIGHILLRRQTRSASTLAWIVVIFALPLVGIVGYLLLGETRLSKKRIARHAELIRRAEASAHFRRMSPEVRRPEIPSDYRPLATLAEAVGTSPALGGNQLDLIGDTEVFVGALVRDIEAATDHCHLLFYIYLDDSVGRRVAEALYAAAKRGVTCRLLVDAVGSRSFARSRLRASLEAAGVRVVEALPANPIRMLFARLDLRNHRKLATIDGAIGYMGSHNIADAAFAAKRRYAPWIDAMVRVRGPVTWTLDKVFAEDWSLDANESLDEVMERDPPVEAGDVTAQTMATGPNAYNEALRQLMLTAIHAAREEMILTTPYFVPDDATALALVTSARRGADTRLIVPARNDSPLVAAASRSRYDTLLEAGVRIFEYEKGLLHAKTLTIDRRLALLGTANLDRRSFELNFELSMVVYDTDFASRLRFLQTSYLNDSRSVDLLRWRRRPWPTRLWQNTAGTLSPLL